MNTELKDISEWFKTNRLSLNIKKPCYISFHSPKTKIPNSSTQIMIDECIIERVTNIKFLGVYIDECLTWTNHIDIIANKIAKNIGIIRKIAYLIPSNNNHSIIQIT